MKVLERFQAGDPRGSWPAEARAAEERGAGNPDAEVIMDLPTDRFLVVTGRTVKDGAQ